MAEKIDDAYVEIHPDVDDFTRDTNRELTTAFRSIERKLDGVVDSIEDGFSRLIHGLEISFDNLAYDVRNSFDNIGDGASATGRQITTSLATGANAAERSIDDLADSATRDLRRIERQARSTGRAVGTSMLGMGIAGGASAISQLSEVGSVLRNLASIPSSIGGSLFSVLKVAAIAAAVPAVIALTGALIDLSGIMFALPAAAGVLVAAIAPIPIAFMGMGDAIEALVSGDLEKLDEALKKLSPSARAFVLEIRGILDPMRQLRNSVQEAFFAPLRGTLTVLGQTLLPVLNAGLTKVAGSLGTVAAQFGKFLSSGDVLNVFRSLFDSTARFVAIVGPAFISLFGTFFGEMQTGLPVIERFGFWLADVIEKFRVWSSNAISSGGFMRWIEEGIETLKSLGRLTGAVFGLIKAMAGEAGDEGRGFIDTLTEMTNRLTAFFNSAEGQEFTQNLLDGLKAVGQALFFFVDVIKFAGNAINSFYDGTARVRVGFMMFWTWIKSIGTSAATTFGSIGAWVTSMWMNVVTFFTTTVPAALASALDFVTRIPGMLRDQAVQAFDNLFFLIGFGIGKIVQWFQLLPTRLAAIFVIMWLGLIATTQAGFNRVVGFFAALPGQLAGLAIAAWNLVRSLFQQGVNNSVSTVSTLPGRVWSALSGLAGTLRQIGLSVISSAYGIGRDITNGIINGISDGIGRLVSTAARAARSALDGAKRALGIASPSKEWAKLGVASVEGYVGAVDKSMNVSANDIASAVQAPMNGVGTNVTNNNHGEGGTTVVNFILDGEIVDRRVITSLHNNPQEVTKAAEAGQTQLNRRR